MNKYCCLLFIVILCYFNSIAQTEVKQVTKTKSAPNIVFFIADDWGFTASYYADNKNPSPNDIVKTPNIDQVAKEGVRFNNAYFDCPQCAPSRGAIVTGSYFWKCGTSAFLSTGDWKGQEDPFVKMPRFPEILSAKGYETAKAVKTLDFKPTLTIKTENLNFERYGMYVSKAKTTAEQASRKAKIIEYSRKTLQSVINQSRSADKPFFLVFGPINTHRPYVANSGKTLWGINPDLLKGKLPPFLPDVDEVRIDYADYLGEVQALDLMVGTFVEELKKAGLTDNTILVLTGDNGLPGFPHGKTQLYDLGTHAPLIIKWPSKVKGNRVVDDFVTIKDLAATFLDAATISPPIKMDSKSLMPILLSLKSGQIDPSNDAAIFGRERHFPIARVDNLPYPSRAIRTKDFLYVRNFKTDRWPWGHPYGLKDSGDSSITTEKNTPFLDMDESLTKTWILNNRFDSSKKFYDATFAKRPLEELYDLKKDPYQLNNVAKNSAYKVILKKLSDRLMASMKAGNDPRLTDDFDRFPYITIK